MSCPSSAGCPPIIFSEITSLISLPNKCLTHPLTIISFYFFNLRANPWDLRLSHLLAVFSQGNVSPRG
jgi:hypothetical protein